MNEIRDSIDVFYIKMAYLASQRSTCIRRKVGAVIVRDKVVLGTGYNGAPKKIEHCNKNSCIRKKLNIPSGEKHELCRGSHAEANAIAQAAANGININGATLYCTTQPCIYCAKLCVNAGIKRIVFSEPYNNEFNDLIEEMLQNIQVDMITIDDQTNCFKI
mgnify:CR=1 FL=1